MRTFSHRLRFPRFLALTACLFLAVTGAHAEDPPAPAPAPAAQPLPAPTPAPQPLPKPGEELKDPPVAPKRKEEEAEPPAPAAPAPAEPASLGSRVSAAMKALQGQGAVVQQLAQRDLLITNLTQERDQFRSQLAERDLIIASLRGELQQVENAMQILETKQSTVVDTIAGLGFPAHLLPEVGSLEQASSGSIEGLQDQMKSEKSADKRAELAQQIISLRDAAAKKKASRN